MYSTVQVAYMHAIKNMDEKLSKSLPSLEYTHLEEQGNNRGNKAAGGEEWFSIKLSVALQNWLWRAWS